MTLATPSVPPATTDPMVDLRDLSVTFTGGRKPVQAVSGVSLQVQRGEVVALIGESGSGKSVTLRTLLRLHPERRTRSKKKASNRAVLGRRGRNRSR